MNVKITCSFLFCLVVLLASCEADKSSVPNDERIGDQIIAALDVVVFVGAGGETDLHVGADRGDAGNLQVVAR